MPLDSRQFRQENPEWRKYRFLSLMRDTSRDAAAVYFYAKTWYSCPRETQCPSRNHHVYESEVKIIMKVLRCEKCGNMVLPLIESGVPVMCCGAPMKELEAGVSDGALEKHVPAVTADGNRFDIAVGEVAHPMMDAHYIQWIALESKEGIAVKKLAPGEDPAAKFALTDGDSAEAAYEFCNLHGLWKKDI